MIFFESSSISSEQPPTNQQVGVVSRRLKVTQQGSLAGAEGLGNFKYFQSVGPKLLRPIRLSFRRPKFPTFENAPLLGDFDSCHLTLTPIIQFDLSETKQQSGDHAPDWTIEFELLHGDGD